MSILEQITPQAVPLRSESDGTLRVGSSRVTLDTVIRAFRDGASLEAIVDRYPTLSLTDVYSVVTYYLWNRETVDAYLREQEARLATTRAEIEAQFPRNGFRDELLKRRALAEP